MLNALRSIFVNLMKPINTTVTVLLGVLTFLWGLWVMSPWWSVFGSSTLYARMSEFAPEFAWGAWATVAGFIQLTAALRGNMKFLTQSLEFIAWHWFIVALTMWFGNWQNTGGLTYSVVCLYSVFCYLNVKLNYIGIDPDSRVNYWILRILRRQPPTE